MRNALVIAGREIAAYFVQPIAYVVMTVFLLLGGWFFFALLRRFDLVQQMYMAMQNPMAPTARPVELLWMSLRCSK